MDDPYFYITVQGHFAFSKEPEFVEIVSDVMDADTTIRLLQKAIEFIKDSEPLPDDIKDLPERRLKRIK